VNESPWWVYALVWVTGFAWGWWYGRFGPRVFRRPARQPQGYVTFTDGGGMHVDLDRYFKTPRGKAAFERLAQTNPERKP
jgi:hypothetical protein